MSTMTVTALGVAGGPSWMLAPESRTLRHGISTLVEVDGRGYLVDIGTGAGRQLARARMPIAELAGVFVTHLHSDHVIDLASLPLFGIWSRPNGRPFESIPIYGPGDRGVLPPVSPRATSAPQPIFPEEPTPGVDRMLEQLLRAFATDFNDRILDTLSPSPADCFHAAPIAIPEGSDYHPNEAPFADIEPWVVHEDDRVRVTTTLVRHPPMAPAFGYRFDSAAGSVVVSGDTAPSANLERLSRGATLLFHEAFDFGFLTTMHGPEAEWDEATRSLVDHHRKAHTDPADAVAIATRAGVGQLALHHLFPPNQSHDAWRDSAGDSTVVVLEDLDRFVVEDGEIVEFANPNRGDSTA